MHLWLSGTKECRKLKCLTYWMNGVILGYKRKEDIYKLLRNFLLRGVKVASYNRDEIPRVSSGSGVSE